MRNIESLSIVREALLGNENGGIIIIGMIIIIVILIIYTLGKNKISKWLFLSIIFLFYIKFCLLTLFLISDIIAFDDKKRCVYEV